MNLKTMRIHRFFPTALLLLATACGGEVPGDVSLEDIPAFELTAETLDPEEELLAPRKVFALQECLVLFESKNTAGFLRFIDKRDGRTLATYGNIGNAEDEFLQPNLFASDSALMIVSIRDHFRKVGFRDGRVTERIIRPTDTKAAFGANFAATTPGGTVVVSSPSYPDRLIFLRADGSRNSLNDYPIDMPRGIDPYYYKEVIFQVAYATSPTGEQLFAAAQHYPIAQVIDAEDLTQTTLRLKSSRRNTLTLQEGIPTFDDPVLFYTYACASREFFYALYQQARTGEMRQGRSEIHLFDRSGRLLRRYPLDRRIYHFTVEADDSRLYALSLDGEHLPRLCAYTLPER